MSDEEPRFDPADLPIDPTVPGNAVTLKVSADEVVSSLIDITTALGLVLTHLCNVTHNHELAQLADGAFIASQQMLLRGGYNLQSNTEMPISADVHKSLIAMFEAGRS